MKPIDQGDRQEPHTQKKQSKYRRGKRENLHHMFPKSRGGTNESENLTNMLVDVHEALHKLFGNGTPREQIAKVAEINTVFTDRFKRDLYDMLTLERDDYYYKDGVYVPKNHKQRKRK